MHRKSIQCYTVWTCLDCKLLLFHFWIQIPHYKEFIFIFTKITMNICVAYLYSISKNENKMNALHVTLQIITDIKAGRFQDFPRGACYLVSSSRKQQENENILMQEMRQCICQCIYWRIQRGGGGGVITPLSKFFHFQAVFRRKFCQIMRLAPLSYWKCWIRHSSILDTFKYYTNERHDRSKSIQYSPRTKNVKTAFPSNCVSVAVPE